MNIPQFPPLPFAVFDEFGEACEDRVDDHYHAAREAQYAALAEQEPVGETLYRVKAGQQVLSAVVYEKFHTLPRGTLLYTRPYVQSELDAAAERAHDLVAGLNIDDAPAAQERAEPVAPAVGELRFLTQKELDSIGSHAEGMDGQQWDRWVQEKFAEVNGLKVKGAAYGY